MQIGFHLSAQVVISSQLEANGTRGVAANGAASSQPASSSHSNHESQLSFLLSMGEYLTIFLIHFKILWGSEL